MKIMKKLALLLAVGTLALGLMTGCGDSSDEKDKPVDISGAWELTTIKNADGDKMTLKEYCTSVGLEFELAEALYEFDGDKTVKATLGGYEVEGSYTFDGSTVKVTFGDQETPMYYDEENDYLYASDDNTGLTSYLIRQ